MNTSGSEGSGGRRDGSEPETVNVELRAGALSVPPADVSRDLVLGRAKQVRFRGEARPTVGKMILLARLGQGGMGVVYFGVHPRLGVEVAVKVLAVQGPTAGEPEHVARFLREARLAAQLRSDHLVSVLDVDHDDDAGLHYIVMEYVRGVSALAWLEAHRKSMTRVSEPDALDICIAATRGLAAAHEAGIVHRDVKPDNILLPLGQDGSPALRRAKLADLGLARHTEGGGTVTATPGTMGSPGFMAPEQVDGRVPATRASDVFGMGATLHALLAGESPFSGATPMQTIFRTIQDRRESIRKLRPDVSDATATVIEKCLAADPTKRFPDAMTLLAALEPCRAGFAATAPAALEPMDDLEPPTRDLRSMSAPPPALAAAQSARAAKAATVAREREEPTADVTPTPPAGTPPPGAGTSPVGNGTVVVPPTAAPPTAQPAAQRPAAPPPQRSSKAPLFIALGVVALVLVAGAIAVVLFLRSKGFLGGSPATPNETPPTVPAPRHEPGPPKPTTPAPPTSNPPPTDPAPRPATPTGPDPAEVQREAEAQRRRDEAAKQVSAAQATLLAGRPADALTEFVRLRRDLGADATPAVAAGIRDAVRAILDAVEKKRAAGDLDGAAADLEKLRAVGGAAPAAVLGADDGYDADRIAASAQAIRNESLSRSLGRALITRAEKFLADGKFDEALRELRKAQKDPAFRDDATRGVADVLRAALRRARERDASGEHLPAIDDFDLVLRERAALPADGSIDAATVTLDLAEACLAVGEWRHSESALAGLTGDDATTPRAVVLLAKSGLAKNGGDDWPADRRDRMTGLPAEAKGREADDQLGRGDRALARGEFDAATLDARVALVLTPRSTRAKFILGAAAARRIAGGRRRATDLDTARNQLRTVISDATKTPSPELDKLRADAQSLLDTLPRE